MVPKVASNVSSSSSLSSSSTDCQGSDEVGKSPSGFYYLSADARKQLPNYQYRGCDKSLLYAYVLSPLAQFLVDNVVPETAPPNGITLFGLIWMVVAYVLYWFYVPTLDASSSSNEENQPPSWIFLYNCIAMLVYQTLDNMDGKQARKTGSSSPLGLLFDHGCDAINSIFGSANWIIGMGLVPTDNLLACWALIFGPYAMFYIATWEQYHTGELILPIVNGPNEGLLGGAMLSLSTYFLGTTFWQQTTLFDQLQSVGILPENTGLIPVLRNCDVMVLCASMGFLQEIISKFFTVARKYENAIRNLLPFTVFSLSFLWIGYVQPTVWLSNPRTCLHLSTLLFTEMTTEVMLAHITAQKFQYLRWHVIPLIALGALVTVSGHTALIDYLLMAYTWSLAGYLMMKITFVIHEICNVLEIWCFDIVTPYPVKEVIRPNEHHKNE